MSRVRIVKVSGPSSSYRNRESVGENPTTLDERFLNLLALRILSEGTEKSCQKKTEVPSESRVEKKSTEVSYSGLGCRYSDDGVITIKVPVSGAQFENLVDYQDELTAIDGDLLVVVGDYIRNHNQ